MGAVGLRSGGRCARPRRHRFSGRPYRRKANPETQTGGEPIGARVDVARALAHEAAQEHVPLRGELHRQARRRARWRRRRRGRPGSPSGPARSRPGRTGRRSRPAAASGPASSSAPSALSIALWRPTSSRSDEQPSCRTRTGRWRAGRPCGRSRAARGGRLRGAGSPARARRAGPARWAAPRGARARGPPCRTRRTRRSGESGARRPGRAGARSSFGLPRRSPRAPPSGLPRRCRAGPAIRASPARKPAASCSSSPGVRIVTASGLAVDPDFERLLDGHLVAEALAARRREPARSRSAPRGDRR